MSLSRSTISRLRKRRFSSFNFRIVSAASARFISSNRFSAHSLYVLQDFFLQVQSIMAMEIVRTVYGPSRVGGIRPNVVNVAQKQAMKSVVRPGSWATRFREVGPVAGWDFGWRRLPLTATAAGRGTPAPAGRIY